MRVAFIHPFLFRYARGIERFTLNLADALARRKVDVHLLTWRWRTPIRMETLGSGIHVHEFPTSRYFAASFMAPFYAWHLRAHKYDFAWIFFAGYGEARALSLAPRQRFGIVFHYPFEQVPHRYREFQSLQLINRAELIVSVSQHVANGVREFSGCQSAVIHHGVDTKRFAPDAQTRAEVRASLNLPPNSPVLVTAAALEERKGVQWVLRALPQILREFPDTHYLILGDGMYRAALDKIASALHVEDHVHFLGAQENVERFYKAADVMLVLAYGEASSLSALEALACEVPVIAARRPPFGELIAPSYGLLVNEQDLSEVAGAVNGLLENPARRYPMGREGRTRVIADYSWDDVAMRYLQLMNG